MEQHQEVNNHSTGGSYGHPPWKPVSCCKLRNRVYVLQVVLALAVGRSWSLATGTSQLVLSNRDQQWKTLNGSFSLLLPSHLHMPQVESPISLYFNDILKLRFDQAFIPKLFHRTISNMHWIFCGSNLSERPKR